MNTPSIVDFLNDRLDEDEQVGLSACVEFEGEPWTADEGSVDCIHPCNRATVVEGAASPAVADHIARHDPARVLREVQARRRILARHREVREGDDYWGFMWSWVSDERGESQPCCGCGASGDPDSPNVEHIEDCPELRDLAAIYADHPDYQQEWA
ncbi:DUF6221 family protein [Prescottella agglutinans]|uniref:Uncharacterized protein n=1 Tax=Prescottella agglutinans TaxID=1644129 RepID=A0ABT6MEW7_9NOCA|nr:DUF6221 family protein [Prescottella agglutinans]MDH6282858.1 hypothetical protein [Prescottella agglutinans]